MQSTYNQEDVTILLNDITDTCKLYTTEERDALVRKGVRSRSLTIQEYLMSDEYTEVVTDSYDAYLPEMVNLVARLANKLYKEVGEDLVLVSIIRAGVPVGILVKRYIKYKYGVDIPHYGISSTGFVDDFAIRAISFTHKPNGIRIIDGWTGSGTAAINIKRSIEKCFPNVDSGLYVLVDPGHVAKWSATRDDVFIPYSPLNAVATGLISVTTVNDEGFNDAAYLYGMEDKDLTNHLLDAAAKKFTPTAGTIVLTKKASLPVNDVVQELGVDKDKITVGVNEVARALLRRRLRVLYVNNCRDTDVICKLAALKGVPIIERDCYGYNAISVAEDRYLS